MGTAFLPVFSTVMSIPALLLSSIAAAAAAPYSPVKAASPYYTPPVYSEVSYGPHLLVPGYSHHHHHNGYVQPGHVYSGYNGLYAGYNNHFTGYHGYNYHHGYNLPYYNNVVLK